MGSGNEGIRLETCVSDLEVLYLQGSNKSHKKFLTQIRNSFFSADAFVLFEDYAGKQDTITLRQDTGTDVAFLNEPKYSALSLNSERGLHNFLIIRKNAKSNGKKDNNSIIHYSESGGTGIPEKADLSLDRRYTGYARIYGWNKENAMIDDQMIIGPGNTKPLVDVLYLALKEIIESKT